MTPRSRRRSTIAINVPCSSPVISTSLDSRPASLRLLDMALARWTRVLPTPLIVLASLPLVAFAALTTILAFSTLFVRVAVVYVELFLALLQSALNATSPTNPVPRSAAVIEDDEEDEQHFASSSAKSKSNRRSRSSTVVKKSISSISLPAKALVTPLSNKQLISSVPNSATTPTARDYEGVGGWHIALEDDGELSPPEESSWLGSSNFLELPFLATPSPGKSLSVRRHKRRSNQPSSTGSPVLGSRGTAGSRNSPYASSYRGKVSGNVSPEGYFNSQVNLHAMNSSARVARSEPADSGTSRRSSISLSMARVPEYD